GDVGPTDADSVDIEVEATLGVLDAGRVVQCDDGVDHRPDVPEARVESGLGQRELVVTGPEQLNYLDTSYVRHSGYRHGVFDPHDPGLGRPGAPRREDEGARLGDDDIRLALLGPQLVDEFECAEGAAGVEHDDVAIPEMRCALPGDVTMSKRRDADHD